MQIYLVGGAVRDKLLGYPVYEQDWLVVGATVEQMLQLGYQQVGKDFPVFLHPRSKDEYALARTERKSGQGYTGFVCHASPEVTIEEDLQRRDLTINAMAMDKDGAVIDPYGGQADLEKRLLRHVSQAFGEDPLRILRLARFASRYHHLGFSIAEETFELMQTMVAAGELEHLVAERVWKETQRSLMQQNADVYFSTLAKLNCLDLILPGFNRQAQQSFALPSLKQAEDKLALHQRWALLLCDVFAQLQLKGTADRIDYIERIEEQLKLPKQLSQFASGLVFFADFCHNYQRLNAEQILSALKTTKLLRDDKLLTEYSACFDFVASTFEPELGKTVKQLLGAIQAIDNREFIEQGLSGKAIGDAIEARQLALITSAFDHLT